MGSRGDPRRVGAARATGLALLAAGGVLALRRTVVVVRVTSGSMSPALAPGDQVLARRLPPRRVRHGDVVLATLPPAAYSWDDPVPVPGEPDVADDPSGTLPGPRSELFVKRVVGLPGDVVTGAALAAAVPDGRDLGDVAGRRWLLPPASMFVLGDGVQSDDSVRWGPVPLALVQARAVLVRTPGGPGGWRRVARRALLR